MKVTVNSTPRDRIAIDSGNNKKVAMSPWGSPSAAFDQANNAYLQANSAYERANSSGSGDIANAYNQANTARNQANTAYGQANSAYSTANGALSTIITIYNQANTAYSQSNISYNQGNAAYDQANSAFLQANTARNQANAAYTKANTSGIDAVNAFTKANTAGTDATNAFGTANNVVSAYTQANTARDHANSAFSKANTSGTDAINAFNQANNATAAFNKANTAGTDAINAFARANTANTIPVGNTLANNMYQVRSSGRTRLNFVPGQDIIINVDDDSADDKANVTITAPNVLAAFNKANVAGLDAIHAFDKANTAGVDATNAFGTANNVVSAYTQANTSRDHANAAFSKANTSGTDAVNAFNQANNTVSAYGQANTARDVANGAYARANTANTYPVGNTLANNMYQVRTSGRSRLNFIPGSNITINVDDDAADDKANITITSTASGGGGPAYDQANTARDTANGAFNQANNVTAAFLQANTAGTDATNAFARANIANTIPVGNTLANNMYQVRSSGRSRLNFIAGTSVTITIDDDAADDKANITISASVTGGDPGPAFDQANIARGHANAAFLQANNVISAYGQANTARDVANGAYARANVANTLPVGNTLSNNMFQVRTSGRSRLNFIPGTSVTIGVDDDSVDDKANVTITVPDLVPAFSRANTAGLDATHAFDKANTAGTDATNAFGQANNVTAAFLQANTAGSTAISAFGQANAAYARANVANTLAVGNTLSNNMFQLRTSLRTRLNFIPGQSVTINVDDDSAQDRANVTITVPDLIPAFNQANNVTAAFNQANNVTAAFNQANNVTAAFLQANTAGSTAISAFGQANAAYARANVANTIAVGNTLSNNMFQLRTSLRTRLNFIPGTSITINVDDDSAQDRANVTITAPDVVAAFNQANNVTAAFLQANTAGSTAISAFGQANAAYARANVANTLPVGNTLSNNMFQVRTSGRSRLNFIPGTSVTINVDDDSADDKANVTITVPDLIAAFNQANNVTAAFLKANTAGTDAINAFGQANNVTAAFLQANTAGSTAISAFGQANAAYGRANTANTLPVGNTLSNNMFQVYTSGRTRLNFIPGSNITINVDDDSSGDRANVTITSTASGGGPAYDQANTARDVANGAYARANVANTLPVGNTLSNGMFQVYTSGRSRLNFIPGSNITINVDDDSAQDRANVTITASITGGDPAAAYGQANAAFAAANSANNAVRYTDGNNGTKGSSNYGDIFTIHANTLTSNVTILSGNNALCAGPLTISQDRTLTIQTGSRVAIV